MSTLIYYSDIAPILSVCIVILFLPVLHKTLIPSCYASIRDFLYEGQVKKSVQSAVIRLLYVILSTMIFSKLLKFDNRQIYLGIASASFLIVWPAIVEFKLYKAFLSKERTICLIGYVAFVFIEVFASYTTINHLMPMVFDGREYFLVENSGLGILFTVFSVAFQLSVETLLTRITRHIRHDIDSFIDEVYIINKQIDFENYLVDAYCYEIDEVCKEFSIDKEILCCIIRLESLFRGQWIMRLIEKVLCKYFIKFAIKTDISVGVTQIRISTAKMVLKQSPEIFIGQLLDTKYNIRVCGMFLSNIIAEYQRTVIDENAYGEFLDQYSFIASRYLCSGQFTANKSVVMYSTILRSRCKKMELQYTD